MSIQRTKRFSTFLKLALEDLARCRFDRRYEVHMGSWHEPFPAKGGFVCRVCLAGAVMARSYKLDITRRGAASPDLFGDRDASRFRALDWFRQTCAPRRCDWREAGFTSSRWALRTVLHAYLPIYASWDRDPEAFVGWAQLVQEALAKEELRVQRRLGRLRRIASDRALREACEGISARVLESRVSP